MINPVSYEFDVLICGGGPGGCTAALTLHDSGLKVAVIEKNKYPREKVCGDGMTSYIPKALNVISPKFRTAFEEFEEQMPIKDLLISSYNGQETIVKLPEQGFISRRYHFDNFLYQQAKALKNVTFFLESQILSVEVDDEKATILTKKNQKFHSKLILGCDGTTSIVRRSLTNYKMDPAVHCASIRAYYENVKNPRMDTFEIYFSSKYPEGYFWIFPSFNNQVNVGFGMFSDKIAKHKVILRDALQNIIDDNPELKKRFEGANLLDDFKGWSIPMGYGNYSISGKRFMLCGDAASLADPSTGEGIGPAMVSGRIAAFHAIKCFKSGDFSETFMKGYDRDIENKFGRQHRNRQKAGKILVRQKWIVNFTVKLLNSTGIISRFTTKFILKLVN
jgi:geranylgeranyl reductase family protein